ncbi:hypothetical protein [Oceanimonas baumannii]|uniref:Uncharacterized protein n=1 Tax=Oceanimonas baumannii TaxID=129578 RepID=A0A235CJF0_9GAMM|nr:hypothetical protein [Oceanimonas baumannii]OYD24718.1 hypothetical protein B6S09_08835 [Oceanimonas baumannii]TDW59465.1 hypothetical protein LY04_01716 [Oceanimonas baumannii]
MTIINTARLLRVETPVCTPALRPEVITHRNRPGFIERQDGSWIVLPIQNRRPNKPKARRRLWSWLAGQLGTGGAA